MPRHYRSMRPAERDAWNERRQAAATATRDWNRMQRPIAPRDDLRPSGELRIEWGGVSIAWLLLPYRRNVRQMRAIQAGTREPVLSDGKPLIGGKDAILRAAAKLLPQFASIRRLDS